MAQDQCGVGIVSLSNQFACGVEEWCSRYAQDAVVTIEASLETSGTAWGRGDDDF
jgi:hypothetical protein